MLIISFLVCVYYNTIIAWVFYYLFESFRSDVPWRDCSNEWNNLDVCYTGKPTGNGIINQTFVNPTTNDTSYYMLSCARHYVPYFAMNDGTNVSTTMMPLTTMASGSNITNTPFSSSPTNASLLPTTVAAVATSVWNVTSSMFNTFFFNCTYSQKIRILPAEEYLK